MDDLARDQALIRALVDHTGLSPAAIAKKIGSAVTTIQRPYKGTAPSRLGIRTLEKLRAKFPDFSGWADDFGIDLSERSSVINIPMIDLRFGLGGSIMDEEVVEGQVETYPFPLPWLRHITKSDPSQLYWTTGQGDSMEPRISNGEIILIDRSQITPSFGDLYWAIAYGQMAMIKRLRPMPDGSVKILSDNPHVPPEIAYDGEMTVFGRVIAVVKTI